MEAEWTWEYALWELVGNVEKLWTPWTPWTSQVALLGKDTDLYRPPRPGTIVTTCISCFRTGGPGKEHGRKKPPQTGRVWERSKGDTTGLTTSQNPYLSHPFWLNKVCTTRKDSESEWLAKDNLEANPITIKPRLWARWQSSSPRFPYPPALHLGALPNKISCLVSRCVSLDNSFPSVR